MSARILILGDCCAPPGEMPAIDEALAAVIAGHDLALCVLEGPVRPPTQTNGPDGKAGPRLCQDPGVVPALKAAGIGCFALGNNHIADHGGPGIAATREALRPCPGPGVGDDDLQALEACRITVQGLRLSIFSACERQAGVLTPGDRGPGSAWICHPELPGRITAARQESDAVLVIAHAGVEEIDLPLPQWRDHYHRLAEAGCDALIGSHPHVPLAHEYHGDALIVHSLGNLYMPAGISSPHPWWNRGMGASLCLDGRRGVASWEPVATAFTPGHVGLGDQSELTKRLADQERILADPVAYAQAIGNRCEALWIERYRPYYLSMLGLGSPRAMLREALVGRRGMGCDPTMGLHNLGTESHRWAVETAMRHGLRRSGDQRTA